MAAKKHKTNHGLPRAALMRIDERVAAKALGPEYGTQVGKLFLAGEITRQHYDAAIWFAALDDGYRRAIGAPHVRSAEIGADRCEPIDPDSARGEAIAASHRRQVKAFLSAARAARGASFEEYRAFYGVAVLDADPTRLAVTRAVAIIRFVSAADRLISHERNRKIG